jgi:hypothetical protein
MASFSPECRTSGGRQKIVMARSGPGPLSRPRSVNSKGILVDHQPYIPHGRSMRATKSPPVEQHGSQSFWLS